MRPRPTMPSVMSARAMQLSGREVVPAVRRGRRGRRRRRCASTRGRAPVRASRLRRRRSRANWRPRRRAWRRRRCRPYRSPRRCRLTMPSAGSAATTRSEIGAYWSRIPAQPRGRRDHVVLGLALRGRELDTGRREQVALELDVGEVVVGEEDSGHEAGGRARADFAPRKRYVRRLELVKRPDRLSHRRATPPL